MIPFLTTHAFAVEIPVGPGHPDVDLQSGIQSASSGDVLVLDPGVHSSSGVQFSGKNLTLQGNGLATIQSTATDALLRVNGGGLTLEGLTLDGGSALLLDLNNSTLTVRASHLTNGGHPSGDGGLVEATLTDVTFEDSQLTNADASRGGLLYVEGDLQAVRTTFENGSATEGSLIHVDGSMTLDASTLRSGSLSSAVHCTSTTTCTITGSHLEDLTGGVLSLYGSGNHRVTATTLCRSGGDRGIDLTAGTLDVERLLLVDNTFSSAALQVGPTGSATLVDTHAVGNTGPVLRNEGTTDLRNTLIAYNTANVAVLQSPGTLSSSYNLYFSNATADSDTPLDATDLTTDPLLVGLPDGACSTDQLTPYSDSPLIDNGDPARTDAEGGPSDIGYFDSADAVPFIDVDGDGFPDRVDCDDTNPQVHPGQAEVACNTLDDDCDATTPDDVDEDVDGTTVCAGDCDDTDPARYPGATEVLCTGSDEDCDPTTSDDVDEDADGVTWCEADCDDTDPLRAPGLEEQRCTGVDEDCDNTTPDQPDDDLDGVGWCDDDCDDSDPTIFPGATETPYDGIDQDCADGDLVDVDGDTYAIERDCDDTDPSIHPFAVDTPDDGIDQDCTGFDASALLTGRHGWRCGCSTSSPRALGWSLPLFAFARRRRR